MLSGAYSNRFRVVERHHVEELRTNYDREYGDVLGRNKRLQQETNRRRKAIAFKRKLEVQKEERRRKEILDRRKAQIQYATDKFQRLGKPQPSRPGVDSGMHSYHPPTPTLEEAMQAIHQETAPGLQRYGSATSVRPRSNYGVVRGSSAGSLRTNPAGTASATTIGADRAESDLRSHSLRNLTNSRSLFEQQLQQHQQLLNEQQQNSLHNFGQSLQHEMAGASEGQGDPPTVLHSDSISSVDSLEGSQPITSPQEGAVHVPSSTNGHIYADTTPITTGFSLHSRQSAGSPNVAVVPPSVVYQSGSDTSIVGNATAKPQSAMHVDNKQDPSCFHLDSYSNMTSKHEGQNGGYNVVTSGRNGRHNGQFYHDSMVNCGNGITVGNVQMDQMSENQLFYDQLKLNEASRGDATGVGMHVKAWATPSPIIDSSKSSSSATMSRASGSVVAASNTPTSVPLLTTTKPHSSRPTMTNATATIACTTSASSSTTNTRQGESSCSGVALSVNTTSTLSGSNIIPGSYSSATAAYSSQNISTKPPVIPQRNGGAAVYNNRLNVSAVSSVVNGNQGNAHIAASSKLLQDCAQTISSAREAEDESDNSDGTVDRESTPEPSVSIKKVAVRSILKKGAHDSSLARNSAHAGLHVAAKKVTIAHHTTSIRDSLDIAKGGKSPHHRAKSKGKKNVRFADLVYEECDSESDGDEVPAPPPYPAGGRILTEKPPRPASAKNITFSSPTTTPAAASTPSKIPRVSSAGTQRRGPFLRPHPPSQPPSGRATLNHHVTHVIPSPTTAAKNSGTSTSNGRVIIHGINTTAGNSRPTQSTTNHQQKQQQQQQKINKAVEDEIRKSLGEPTFDENGMRLDRTPTDDEINWLWDKVRTVLHSSSAASEAESTSTAVDKGNYPGTSEITDNFSRQSVAVSQKNIDGSSLAPQNRHSTRLNHNGYNVGNYNGSVAVNQYTPKSKKVTMETLNNMTKRSSLLNQRTSVATHTPAARNNTAALSTTVQSLHVDAPLQSTGEPSRTITSNGTAATDTTESMAAFVAAEKLAQQSASESEIEHAMDNALHQQHAYNTNNPQNKVPSALSIEEQRLVASLERLNERLKLAETNMYPSSTNYMPRPPAHQSGFMGRQPITGSKRQVNGTYTAPRQNYRISSAPVTRGHHTPGSYHYT